MMDAGRGWEVAAAGKNQAWRKSASGQGEENLAHFRLSPPQPRTEAWPSPPSLGLLSRQ